MDQISYDNECCQSKNIKTYRKFVGFAAKFYLAFVFMLVETMFKLTSERWKVSKLVALQR